MTNTLLNTIGAGSRNFSNMNYMLPPQKDFFIAKKQSILPQPAASLPAVENPAPAAKKEKFIKDDKTKMLLAGLGGLAVIGAGAVLVYNRLKKGKASGTQSSPLDAAKNKARDEFKKLKESMLDEFNENLPDELKVRTGVTFKSSKELEDFKEALKTGDDFSVEKYETMRAETSAKVKAQLQKLEGDSEWQELRKMRKALIKSADTQDDAGKIAREKISIINDLMSYKVDPSREQVFKNRNMMDVSDGFALVRRDFVSADEFYAKKEKVTKYDFDFDIGEGFFAGHKPLTINDLFEDEQDTYNFAKDNLKKIETICAEVIPKAKETLHQKLSELAQGFRTSEFIENLHSFTRKSA